MFVVGSVAVTVFWGGWLRPFPSVAWLAAPLNYGGPLVVFGLVRRALSLPCEEAAYPRLHHRHGVPGLWLSSHLPRCS
jgi:hypothetical protein